MDCEPSRADLVALNPEAWRAQLLELLAVGRSPARAIVEGIEHIIECFAGDLSKHEQILVSATQGVPATDLFDQKVAGTAWKSKPNWYIVAKNDRTVHPDLERFVAKRMGAKTYEVASSHVPMLSNPKLVLDVIRTAANAVTDSQASKRA